MELHHNPYTLPPPPYTIYPTILYATSTLHLLQLSYLFFCHSCCHLLAYYPTLNLLLLFCSLLPLLSLLLVILDICTFLWPVSSFKD